MARTLLQTVRRVCKRVGLPVPSSVITSADAQVMQMRVILEDVISEALTRWNWSQLTRRATFTSVAAESQGTLLSLTGADFVKINNDTLWDLTNQRPILGPTSDREWQARTAFGLTGPFSKYQVRGGELLFTPAPTAGLSISFFWTSNQYVLAENLTTRKSEFSADTDVTVFSDAFTYLGLLYGWKQEKGLPYAEDLRSWEIVAMAEAMGDGTKPILSMDGECVGARPGIIVPEGSWVLV